jgi:hypothetical protein
MFVNSKALSLLVPALAGFGLTGAALASAGSGAAGGPLRCEIGTATEAGMISLQGVAESDSTLNGTYRFTVESVAGSGNSTIRQGGGFSVEAGSPAPLGNVMLSAGGIYDARLELSAGGESVACEQRVGGSL